MRIKSNQQIQYGGPDSTEAQKIQKQNETSLGIGSIKDSFETTKSIADGTSIVSADGSVKIGHKLSPGLVHGFNPQPDPPVLPLESAPGMIKDAHQKIGIKE
jgi:hypothetical protein